MCGQDLGLGEGADAVADELVLVGQGEVDHRRHATRPPAADADAGSRRYTRAMDTAPNLTPVLGRYFEREWSHGVGHRLYDTDGKAYLDFANGIAVTALGHAHPRVTAADPRPGRPAHRPDQRARLHRADLAPRDRARGDLPRPARLGHVPQLRAPRSIDGALKLARRVTGRPGIIAFRGGFHGRTFGATSVTTSNLNYRTGYEPLLPGVYFAPYPTAYPDFGGDEDAATEACLAGLRRAPRARSSRRARSRSVLIEPVQGEGGYDPAPAAFLRGLRELCDEHGILLIADEVQSGLRADRADVGVRARRDRPGRRVPSPRRSPTACRCRRSSSSRELQERWGRGAHGSTYGGNPVACAAGLAVLETIRDEGLVANAVARGAELPAGLEAIAAEDDRIGDVRGPGLMVGVEFVRDRATREPDGDLPDRLMAACADAGLLVLTCGRQHEIVRWIPPLDVTAAEIAEAVEIFGETLGRLD